VRSIACLQYIAYHMSHLYMEYNRKCSGLFKMQIILDIKIQLITLFINVLLGYFDEVSHVTLFSVKYLYNKKVLFIYHLTCRHRTMNSYVIHNINMFVNILYRF